MGTNIPIPQGGFYDCLPTAICRAHPVGQAASVLDRLDRFSPEQSKSKNMNHLLLVITFLHSFSSLIIYHCILTTIYIFLSNIPCPLASLIDNLHSIMFLEAKIQIQESGLLFQMLVIKGSNKQTNPGLYSPGFIYLFILLLLLYYYYLLLAYTLMYSRCYT